MCLSSLTGPYTVFAPEDSAFNNLPKNIEKIFDYGNWKLANQIVTFHIALGNYSTANLQNEQQLPTYLGQPIRYNVYKNSVRI